MGKNFGAVDHLNMTGDGNPLGTDFYCHKCEPTYGRDQANVTDERGEYDPESHHAFNEVIKYDAEYRCKIRTLIEGLTITTGSDDSMAIETVVLQQVNKEYAMIRMTAHKHPDANFGEHLDNTRTITLPDFLGFGANDHLEVFASELDVQKSDYTISIGSQDDQNNIGEHLVGRSQGEMHTCVVEAVTDEIPGDPAIGGQNWKVQDKRTPRINNGQYRASITATMLVAGPV